LAGREIAYDQRHDGADGGRQGAEQEGVLDRELRRRQFEEDELDVVEREIVERDELRRDPRERRVEQGPIWQKDRTEQNPEYRGEREPAAAPELDLTRIAL